MMTRQMSQATASLTGVELISPVIGLNEDQRAFFELAKQFSDTYGHTCATLSAGCLRYFRSCRL